MQLKDQITQAIKTSQEKAGSLILKWESEPHSVANFNTQNKRSAKHIDGKLLAADDRLVALISSTSYSDQYAKQKIRAELKKLNVNTSNLFFEPRTTLLSADPKPNDVVTTKRFIDQLQPGEHKTLDRDTDWFAVNNDLINCNGQPLKQAFEAEFIEQFNRKCGNNSFPALTYTKFKLIKTVSV